MRTRFRLMIGLGALALGLFGSQLPSRTVFADISVCTNCDAVNIGTRLVSEVPAVSTDTGAVPVSLKSTSTPTHSSTSGN